MELLTRIPPPKQKTPEDAELPPECCGKCRFFNPHPPAGQMAGQSLVGICHRYPPVAQILGVTPNRFSPKGPPDLQTGRVMPQVAAPEWCGEFQAIPPKV